MKKAIIGVGLLVCGTIGVATQRIVDALFTANGWQISHTGVNLMYVISIAVLAAGAVCCILALRRNDD